MSTDQYSIDYYSMLGVARDASTKEINIAFKKLALKLHPDKSGGDQGLLEQFHKAREAVETLRDPERRRRYDELFAEELFVAKKTSYQSYWYCEEFGYSDKIGRSDYYHDAMKASPPKQEHKNRHNMWGPFIYAYNTNSPKPNLRTSKVVTPQSSSEDKEPPVTQGVDQAQESSYEEREAGVRSSEMTAQGVKSPREYKAQKCDRQVNELVYSEDESIWHDTAEHGSVTSSFCEHDSSSSEAWWASCGPDKGLFVNDGPSSLEEDEGKDDETMRTIYYDCVEHLGSNSDDHSVPVDDDEHTEGEAADEHSSIQSALRPFVDHLKKKLKNSDGCYTTDDCLEELNGLIMEAVRVWLESQRVLPQGRESTSNEMDRTKDCEHIGLWKEQFDRPECEVCHLWQPIYVMTCSGCGKQACVRCKFTYTADD